VDLAQVVDLVAADLDIQPVHCMEGLEQLVKDMQVGLGVLICMELLQQVAAVVVLLPSVLTVQTA
jgi:hypothetical protein